jgi:hypothetical protein
MTRGHVAIAAVIIALAAPGLAYLRDPPWLIHMESGFRRWETDSTGVRYRWTSGHASFFVPSGATNVTIPLRTTFANPAEWPIAVTITIDDRAADRIVLSDDGWRSSTLRLPPGGRRRVRRIDLRADRARDGNRAVQVGEVTWQMASDQGERGTGR